MQFKKKLAYIVLKGVLLGGSLALPLSGAVLITVRAQAPQQAQIAFVSERDGNPEIYVMDSDGKNPRNLTNHPANDYIDDWFDPTVGRSVSPAGKQLTVWGEIKRK